MQHQLLARDDVPYDPNPNFARYYQVVASCTTDKCPDSYWNFLDSCTSDTCPISSSNFDYLPSLAANGIFLALFAVSLVCFLGQGVLSKKFIGFTVSMVSGCILEVLGYIGRLMAHHNPWAQDGFLMQIVCLTIAPAFFAAGIYLTLSRVVVTIGAGNSRIKPIMFPRIFIPCDFLSLLLQAIGGGMASTESNNHQSVIPGDNIMIAGLAFQVFTLGVFILICTDFAVRTLRNTQRHGASETFDASHAVLRRSLRFRGFVVALALATICIFIRSVYRVIELSQGWNGSLIKVQRYFIVLEGVMVLIAVLALNVFHPGFCFKEGYDGEITHVLKGRKGEYGVEASVSEKPGRKWLFWKRNQ